MPRPLPLVPPRLPLLQLATAACGEVSVLTLHLLIRKLRFHGNMTSVPHAFDSANNDQTACVQDISISDSMLMPEATALPAIHLFTNSQETRRLFLFHRLVSGNRNDAQCLQVDKSCTRVLRWRLAYQRLCLSYITAVTCSVNVRGIIGQLTSPKEARLHPHHHSQQPPQGAPSLSLSPAIAIPQ